MKKRKPELRVIGVDPVEQRTIKAITSLRGYSITDVGLAAFRLWVKYPELFESELEKIQGGAA